MAKHRAAGVSSLTNVVDLDVRPKVGSRRPAARPHLSLESSSRSVSCDTCVVSPDSRLLAAIVRGSDDAVIGESLDGTLTTWNPGAARIFGYTPAEMMALHLASRPC